MIKPDELPDFSRDETVLLFFYALYSSQNFIRLEDSIAGISGCLPKDARLDQLFNVLLDS
jgi:hypothetical protein